MNFIASSSIIRREQDDHVLIGKRSLKKQFGPGQWEMIGGSIEHGETPEECIDREIKEELGVIVDSKKFFKDYSSNKGVTRVFIVTIKGKPAFSPDDFEELLWVSKDELVTKNFVLDCKQRLLDYFITTP